MLVEKFQTEKEFLGDGGLGLGLKNGKNSLIEELFENKIINEKIVTLYANNFSTIQSSSIIFGENQDLNSIDPKKWLVSLKNDNWVFNTALLLGNLLYKNKPPDF